MLDSEIANSIVESSLKLLGAPYREDYRCIEFAREVYSTVGLSLPPPSMNLTVADMKDPPIGYVLYLRHKAHRGTSLFTHVVITLSERRCIHASYYFGMAVVITDLDVLLELYDVAT